MKILASLFLILVGCSDDDTTGPNEPVLINAACIAPGSDCEILPMAVGNEWIYEYILFNPDSSIIAIDTAVLGFVRDTIIDNETWYLAPPAMYINRSDGCWAGEITGEQKGLYLYPGQPGDTFSCVDCAWGYQLVSVTDTVTIGLGTYLCYKYRSDSQTGEVAYNYVAPGVGRILYKSYFGGDENSGYLQFEETLIEVNLQ